MMPHFSFVLPHLWLSGERLQVARELERSESPAVALATMADIASILLDAETPQGQAGEVVSLVTYFVTH
jgi:hypothetical protein